MDKDDRIYVAGHRGLVGSAVVRALEAQGYTNIVKQASYELDLTNQELVNLFFERNEIDYVILCAAKVGGILSNKTYPADFIHKNLLIQTNVIHSAYVHGVKKLCFLGSSCIYPKFCEQPIKEEYLLNGDLEPTNDAYAVAKIAGIKMCQAYRRQYGFDCISLMPTNLYGECFSKDTYLSTPNGWKLVSEFKVDDEIFTLNPKTHNVEIEKVCATQKRKSNKFINFKGPIVDIRVTPEHRIYYKTSTSFLKRKASYFEKRAGKKYGQIRFAVSNGYNKYLNINEISLEKYLKQSYIVKNEYVKDSNHPKCHWIPLKYNIEDFCNFIGWYVSEGSRNSKYTNQISIHQSLKNDIYRDDIEKLLQRMSLPIQRDDDRFYFSSELWKTFIESDVGINCNDKKIPEWLIPLLDENCIRILFSSLMKGDGDKSGLKYSTNSDKLKDQILLLAPLIGINIGKVYKENNIWRLVFRKIKTNSVKYKNILVENNEDEEDVFCVTTEKNHIVYAKRNNCCSWIGQCDNFDLQNSHVLPALISKFVTAKHMSQKVTIWGTGTPKREFLYSDDLADAIIFLMNNYSSEEIINVGTGKDISILELATRIANIVGYNKSMIQLDASKPDGTPRKLLDVSKINNLGWQAKTSIDEGLKKTIDWYNNQ